MAHGDGFIWISFELFFFKVKRRSGFKMRIGRVPDINDKDTHTIRD